MAFGLELKTLQDDQTPFPHAILMVTKGLSTSRIPFFEVSAGFSQTLSLSDAEVIASQANSEWEGEGNVKF